MQKYLAGLLILFFSFTVQAQTDYWLLESVVSHRNPSHDATFNAISKSIYPASLGTCLVTLGTGIIQKNQSLKHKSYDMMLSLAASMGTTYLLKNAINRPRPYQTHPQLPHYYQENDASFPSGHTTAAFSTATSLTIAFPKWYVAVPAFAYAGAVGYSRMHLGVHYPTDVLAGAAIGAGSAFVSAKVNRWLRGERRRKN